MRLEDYFNGGCAPILIIDDEEDNVADLTEVLDRHYAKLDKQGGKEFENFPDAFYAYVSSPEDALELMKKMQEKGYRYNSIISDFNMSPINGKDFFRVVFDRLLYALTSNSGNYSVGIEDLEADNWKDLERELCGFDREVLEFVEQNFDYLADYVEFVKYWNDRRSDILKIIFAGADKGDYYNDAELDLKYFRKSDGCEEAILDLLCIRGVLPKDIYDSFFDHERFNPNSPPELRAFKPGKKINHHRSTN